MRFARYTFAIAGIYGLIALLPQYFLERQIGIDHPPPIAHPEYFYGFVGVALAFQIVFLIIATDPMRYRPIMLAAVVEKFSFGIAAIILYLQARMTNEMLVAAAGIDILLGLLFIVSYLKTPGTAPPAATSA